VLRVRRRVNEQHNDTQKTDLGWVVDVPNEIAQVLGVAEGSIALLHANEGRLEVEILPPPSAEWSNPFAELTKSTRTPLRR